MGKKKKDEIETENEFGEDDDDDDGCCPDTHAKCFEIVLIVGFLFSIIALTVNMILNLWFFKFSTFLLIGQIVPMALNVISFIISIILRCWRSDNSVFKKNFSSSSSAACFLLVLVIINFLSAVGDDVLFYFAYNYIHASNELDNIGSDEAKEKELLDKLSKAEKMYFKIMDKYNEEKGYGLKPDQVDSKMYMLELLPWVVFNVNAFMQFLAIILDCILMGRIKLKNHFGFPKEENNKSTKNKIIDNDDNIYEKKMSKNKKKRKKSNGTSKVSPESDITIMKKKKKSQIKKKKKSSSIKKKKY